MLRQFECGVADGIVRFFINERPKPANLLSCCGGALAKFGADITGVQPVRKKFSCLRVIDASVMRANTHLATVMIAECMAGQILDEKEQSEGPIADGRLRLDRSRGGAA